MSARIHLDEVDGVTVVRLARPPANAFDLDFLREGTVAIAELEGHGPPAAVLTGQAAFFSAGVDLRAAPRLDAAGQKAMVNELNALFLALYSLPFPLVAAVNGHAIAGGLIAALCADYRVCASVGRFGLTEVKAGIAYPVAALGIVMAELSPPSARALVLRAHLIDAQEALRLGAVDEVVSPDSVLERALEVAHEMAELPAGAFATVKAQLRGPTTERLRIAARRDPLSTGWLGAEAGAGAAAILDR